MVLRQSLIFVHRWLGVALCLLFLLWFVSGIVMMYWDFPEVRAEDRLRRAPALDPSRIRVSPPRSTAPVLLNTLDGRPVYRVVSATGERRIYADTAEEPARISPAVIDRAASAWTGQPASSAKVESLDDVDQWTVLDTIPRLLPFRKYSWPNGEQVYVSALSGEVVQYTTSRSRFWTWAGPIPHWLYFVSLRRHSVAWSRLVVWTSGISTLAAALGMVIGVWAYSPARPYRYAGKPAAIPYRGPKRWHTILGLIFGASAVTWAFSGMLSMDPFPSARRPRADFPAALRGKIDPDAFQAKPPVEALQELDGRPVKELELTAFGGEPVYLATLASGETRILPIHGRPIAQFSMEQIREAVARAAGRNQPVEVRELRQYDAYYRDRRRRRPLPVYLVRLPDAAQTRYYLDPKTGTVVAAYSSQDWIARWLYHGLHSLDFPWLYRYRPLWDIVVIALLAGGTALCITSLVLAWRVLRRKLVSARIPTAAVCSARSTESAPQYRPE